jgi:predicted ATPase
MTDPFVRRVLVNPRIEVDREKFPFTLPVFKEFQELQFHEGVTFFVGENGSGKSTMIEAMAILADLPAEGGTREHTYSTHDSHSNFWDSLLLAKGPRAKEAMFLRAESFYNLATYVTNAGPGPRIGLVHSRSHGEGFLDAMLALRPPGLYFFDEPESALSFQGQLKMLVLMKELVDAGSQIIIATHSPILLGYGKAWIYEFSESGIQRIPYHQTANYQMTRDFLDNRDRYASMMGLDEISED